MADYDPKLIEPKWQVKWEKDGLYKTSDTSKKPKYYCLDMFPYPSGDGLHVGHFKGYCATDVISRYLRMKGYNVLHPMGWDAFGLPAENYAIKTGVHPKITTQKAIDRIKGQMKIAGFSYDWSREINTTDPAYYKWTQWIFLKLFEKGLAYEVEASINWCPSCKTGLANEEVVNNRCERCGHLVGKKKLRQWVLKITAYADRLLADLDYLDWPEAIKIMQKNWIGKSEGTEVDFEIDGVKEKIPVFTTRLDTIFSGTFVILAPEHTLVSIVTTSKQKPIVQKYIKKAKSMLDVDRVKDEKTGVFTGSYAINPATGEKMPIWIADFVLMGYGTGAVFGDAHDERDFEVAKKFGIPLKVSIRPKDNTLWNKVKNLRVPFVEDGILVNSDEFDGLTSVQAREKILIWLAKKGAARKKINYKLRDWLFSRQRYWGEPIPIVHCPKCGVQAVPEKDLPIKLPEVKKYEPTGTGESPLASIPEFVNTKCPKCGGPAKRETNTMPQWAGSCWYYLRYCDTENNSRVIDEEKEKYWLPADWYVGGAEHAVLHLLYARFWHKFLYDLGIISTKEPFQKLRNVGIVLGEGGVKMSKSRGNVISPDEIINKYGADTLRMYELFMGPFDQMIAWDPASVDGVWRFLGRIWRLTEGVANRNLSKSGGKFTPLVHRLTKKVEEDIQNMRFNTAIAALMESVNEVLKDKKNASVELMRHFVLLLAPFAPHIAEELWQKLGGKYSVTNQPWPGYDLKNLVEEEKVIVVQVNGKLRDKILIKTGESEAKVKELALTLGRVQKYLVDKKVKKVIVIPDRLVNIVVS